MLCRLPRSREGTPSALRVPPHCTPRRGSRPPSGPSPFAVSRVVPSSGSPARTSASGHRSLASLPPPSDPADETSGVGIAVAPVPAVASGRPRRVDSEDIHAHMSVSTAPVGRRLVRGRDWRGGNARVPCTRIEPGFPRRRWRRHTDSRPRPQRVGVGTSHTGGGTRAASTHSPWRSPQRRRSVRTVLQRTRPETLRGVKTPSAAELAPEDTSDRSGRASGPWSGEPKALSPSRRAPTLRTPQDHRARCLGLPGLRVAARSACCARAVHSAASSRLQISSSLRLPSSRRASWCTCRLRDPRSRSSSKSRWVLASEAR